MEILYIKVAAIVVAVIFILIAIFQFLLLLKRSLEEI
ncbi:uncharacterized protein YoxC [Metabacillus crassostreae]|nr:uncharacterized protein YoxC [Metabacillus crassostreae]